MEMRAPLARARGLGSAKEGVGHWVAQRVTGVALVPLSLWFVWTAVSLAGATLEVFRAWASEIGNSMLMILFVIALFHHAQLGMQVVIEDYVHREPCKVIGVYAVKLASFALAVSCILAVLFLAIGG